MKKVILNKIVGFLYLLTFIFVNKNTHAQNSGCLLGNPGPSLVSVHGRQLIVQKRNPDGSLMPQAPYSIKGVCWSPSSRTTITNKNDKNNVNVRRLEFIKWHKTDLPLIKKMNANTIRLFMDLGVSDTAKAILDELFCNDIMVIMTVDEATNDMARIKKVVEAYKNHPAVLMWMIGNEWNIYPYYYDPAISISDAVQKTQDAALLIKTLDPNHPVATGYGDIDINDNGRRLADTKNYVNNICTAVDVWGLNIYRGNTFGSLFKQWKSITSKAMFLSEFGTDAFHSDNTNNPPTGHIDEIMQAQWDMALWNDIFRNLSANDTSKVTLGGTVFEFSDEWWKIQPDTSQDRGGYTGGHPDGFANEEYFGLVDIDRKTRAVYDSLCVGFHPGYNAPELHITCKAESAGSVVPGTSNGFARFYNGVSLFYDGSRPLNLENTRGFNIAAIDTATGQLIVPVRCFDTWSTRDNGIVMNNMVNFLDSLQNGTLIMIAVRDEAGLDSFPPSSCSSLPYSWVNNGSTTLEALGSKKIRNYCYWNSWAMVTVKGEGSARDEQLGDSIIATAQTILHQAPTSYPPFLLAAPVLATPPCGTQVMATSTVLRWNNMEGAVSYHVQVSADSLFSAILIDKTTSGAMISLDNLISRKTYFWHVSAVNAAGISRWSCTWKFTAYIRPFAEVIMAPVNLPVDTLQIKYRFFNFLNAGNSFIIQMTDTSGKENTYVQIASQTDTTSIGVLKVQLSNKTQCGKLFRVKIISTNPSDTSVNSNPFEIINKPVANIQRPARDTGCRGQTILLKADSVPGAGYQWLKDGTIITNATQPTYKASSKGEYRLRVSKGVCDSLSRQVNLVFVPVDTPTITAGGATTFCQGRNVDLVSSATWGNQWYKDGIVISGATNRTYNATTTGSYVVEAVNAFTGCSAISALIEVTVNEKPPKPTVTRSNDKLYLLSSAPTDNQWFENGIALIGDTGKIYKHTAWGLYSVQVTENGCKNKSEMSDVIPGVIDTTGWNGQVFIFPNPFSGHLNIVNNDLTKNLLLQLYDISGHRLLTQRITIRHHVIDMPVLPKGSYVLVLTDENKNEMLRKIIIKQY